MKTKKLLDKNGNPIQIEQSQVCGLKEALANAGGGSGKEVVEVGQLVQSGNIVTFDNISNKYVKWDLSSEQVMDHLQGGLQTVDINFNTIPKNANLVVKIPDHQEIENLVLNFSINGANFVILEANSLYDGIYMEGARYFDNPEGNWFNVYLTNSLGWDAYLKLDFDDTGFITAYILCDYEN